MHFAFFRKPKTNVNGSNCRRDELTRKIEEETKERRGAIIAMVDLLSKHKEWMGTLFKNLQEQMRIDLERSVNDKQQLTIPPV